MFRTFGITLGNLEKYLFNVLTTVENYFVNFELVLLEMGVALSKLAPFQENYFLKLQSNCSTMPTVGPTLMNMLKR